MGSKNKNGIIFLSAGGTGGHLYPAEALAEELLKRGYAVEIVTDKRGNAFQKLDVPLHIVRAATMKAGTFQKMKAVLDMGIGILQSFFLLLKRKPALVVGFGGYPSFPAVFAAQILGVDTILHEQNAVLGKANLWLSCGATAIATSLPETRGLRDQTKIRLTGNPVRAAIRAVRGRLYAAPKDGEAFRILVTGGSQAAKIFSDVMPKAVQLLPSETKSRLSIVHQAKKEDIDTTISAYQAAGVSAVVKPFFDDMQDRLSACHLFIGRSGASTVAEIAVVGRPAIFVPYPGHKDQQQKHNAATIAKQGGAWVVDQPDFTPENLARQMEHLAKNPAILDNAAFAAGKAARIEAVENLAALVEERL